MNFTDFMNNNNEIQFYYKGVMVLKCRQEDNLTFIIPLENTTRYGHITLPNLPLDPKGRETMINLYYKKITEFIDNEQITTNPSRKRQLSKNGNPNEA